jgi:hypothetical protein
MKRLALALVVAMLACVTNGHGQATSQAVSENTPYQPAVPPPSMGGYGGGGYGGWGVGSGVGSTAAGSSLTGMANVISAQGDYNLATSAAAVNLTQAQKNEIQNRQLYTNTYFEMRETNRQAREAERRPRPTAEQLARIAHEDAPKPLSANEVNEITGKINWPQALQLPEFSGGRTQFEKLFVSYSQLGALNYADQSKARKIINDMNTLLKSQIRKIPTPDYVACKKFLEGLMYTTCKSRLG